MHRLLPVWLLVSSALAQNGEVAVHVRVKDGFLTVDETQTTPRPVGFTMPEAKLRRQLFKDVNQVFRAMGRLCAQAFEPAAGDTCPPEAAPVAHLTTNTWEEAKEKWQTWRAADPAKRKSLASVFSLDASPIVSLEEELPLQTGLGFDSGNQDALDFASGRLTFTFAFFVTGKEPIHVADAMEGPRLASDDAIRAALNRLAGGLWRKPEIERSVSGVYPEDRVVRQLGPGESMVGFRVTATDAVSEHSVDVQEGIRLTGIQISPSVGDTLALQAYYYLLPHQAFLELSDLHGVTYTPGNRPLLTADMLARMTNFKSLGLTYGLIKDPSATVQSMRVLKTGDPPPQSATVPKRSSALPEWVRFEFGARYRPGQGIHFLARTSMLNLGAAPQSAQIAVGGASAGGLGGLQYARDFLFFERLRRRLSVAVNGNTEMETKRILQGTLTDERRWTGTARADLEWIPDRDGRLAAFFAEAQRTTVLLQRPNVADASVKIAAINAGSTLSWSTTGLRSRRQFSFEPRIHAGIPISRSYAGFRAYSATAAFRQELGTLWETRVTLRGWESSKETPLVEQPVFGGEEMVRGFRKDSAIGRRAWSAQSELWAPLGIPRTKNPALEMLRGMRVAGFFDAGGIHHISEGKSGLRYGAGPGLRIRVARTVFLKLDYGRGFGVEPGARRGRFYVGADAAF